jgi:hypothetical protein
VTTKSGRRKSDPARWSRVEVVWHDATVTPEWREMDQVEQDDGLVACLTVGLFVRGSRRSITFALTATTAQAVGPTITIPRAWISSVKIIRGPKMVKDPWATKR